MILAASIGRARRRSSHQIRCLLALALGLVLPGCAGPFQRADMPQPSLAGVVYVVSRGWHTDIALPTGEVGGAAGITLQRDFSDARYLVFGFGERAFYLNSRPGFGDMLFALLPGPGAVLVTGLNTTPAAAFGSENVAELGVTATGMSGIARFVSASLDADGDGRPHRIADGPYPGSLFYASPVTYDAFYTCNTWTAQALRQAGLPISPTGILFADQVIEASRKITGGEPGNTTVDAGLH